jgi:hypothetical protein
VKFVGKLVIGTIVVIVTLLLLVAACSALVANSSDEGDGAVTVGVRSEPEPETTTEEEFVDEPTTEEEPPPVADPKAQYDSDCDYVLGPLTNLQFHPRFLGDARIRNTGNVGLVVNVVATWAQAGSPPVAEKKRVRIPFGGRKVVRFNRAASQEELDLHQAVDRYPACKVRATIIDTFGSVRE